MVPDCTKCPTCPKCPGCPVRMVLSHGTRLGTVPWDSGASCLTVLPGGTNMRQDTPWAAIGISRASWYRHGKPATKPNRLETKAEMARRIGVSLRTLYRAQKQYIDQRTARLRQYQEAVLRKLLEKHPGISDEQINDMWKAHIHTLSEEQLGKIMNGGADE
jgi:hypothetical protein